MVQFQWLPQIASLCSVDIGTFMMEIHFVTLLVMVANQKQPFITRHVDDLVISHAVITRLGADLSFSVVASSENGNA